MQSAAAVFVAGFGGLVLLLLSRNPALAWEHLQSRRFSRQTDPPQPWESEWGIKKQKFTEKQGNGLIL